MVVIAIIGILSGIIVTNLTGSKAKSRDAQRVSDVNQIQLALEQYFDRCGQYPIPTGTTNAPISLTTQNGCPSTITFGSYISVIPKDPVSGFQYGYEVNNNTFPTDYILYTTLESSNNAQQNSYSEAARNIVANAPTNPTWATDFHCYDAQTPPTLPTYPLAYCVSTK